MNRAALVLAGGEATRFQTPDQPWQDKALTEINNKPFLVHIIENLQTTVNTIAVCVNNQQRETQYRSILEKNKIRNIQFVLDQKNSPIKGPLLAISSGLRTVQADYCLVVPTDMLFLNPKIANYLFEAAEGFEATAPMWPDGTIETLLMTIERKSCIEIIETLAQLNRDNADTILRAVSKLHLISPLQEIRCLDPELRSFININRPQDLAKPQTRTTQGTVTADVVFNRGELPIEHLKHLRLAQKNLNTNKFIEATTKFAECSSQFNTQNQFFWLALSTEKLGETQQKFSKKTIAQTSYLQAANSYLKESVLYTEKGCNVLAQRALSDKAFCEEKTRA